MSSQGYERCSCGARNSVTLSVAARVPHIPFQRVNISAFSNSSDASTFALVPHADILRRVKMAKPEPTPNWKEILLASPDWPEDLRIPQNDPLPEGSENIQDSMGANEHWEWQLWRHPDGHCYYLKVWPMDQGGFGQPNTPGAALTVLETFHFLMTNWMPRDVLIDLALERPDVLKSLDLPPGAPGLN